jgi:catechol 2,3-dioxygenase-like lactoylglutathione lyase family enzyme
MITGTDFLVMHTKDFDTAVDFYENTLGLPLSTRYGDMPGVEFETGNLTIAVMQSEAFGMEYQTTTNPLALRVDDVHAAKAELEAKGVQFAPETIDSGVCHMAFFRDPDGNALMLHHRYAPRDR